MSFTWGSLDAASADTILGSTTHSVLVFLACRLQLARAASARVVKSCSDWVIEFVCECKCRQNTLASGQRCCTCDFEGVFGTTRWLLIAESCRTRFKQIPLSALAHGETCVVFNRLLARSPFAQSLYVPSRFCMVPASWSRSTLAIPLHGCCVDFFQPKSTAVFRAGLTLARASARASSRMAMPPLSNIPKPHQPADSPSPILEKKLARYQREPASSWVKRPTQCRVVGATSSASDNNSNSSSSSSPSSD